MTTDRNLTYSELEQPRPAFIATVPGDIEDRGQHVRLIATADGNVRWAPADDCEPAPAPADEVPCSQRVDGGLCGRPAEHDGYCRRDPDYPDDLGGQPTSPADADREALDPMTRDKVAARVWRGTFRPGQGVMWSQRGSVPEDVRAACRAVAERLHADGLLAARPSAPTVTAEQEWAVDEGWYGQGTRVFPDEQQARLEYGVNYDAPTRRLLVRDVSPWREVQQ